MRILLAIDHLGTGGAQRQLVNLGAGLQHLGHQVEFFVYYPARDLAEPLESLHIPIWHVAKTRRLSSGVPLALRNRLHVGGYDVALSYLDTPNFYLELASLGVGRTKIVVSQRAQYAPGRLTLYRRMLENCHRLADHLVVNSHGQMRRMVREFPWLAGRMSIISNGVGPQFFAVKKSAAPRPRLRLLAVSTIVPLKNVEALVEALSICQQQAGLSVDVWWVGRIGSSDYFSRLQRRLEFLGLTDNWSWLGQRNDVAALMAQCDGLVHPSHSEGFPNAICEALAAGLPVLAGRIGDHEFLVERCAAGYLFDPARPDELAVALIRFANLQQDERAAMGERARSFAQQELSMGLCTRRYEDLFARLTNGVTSTCAV